MNFQQLEYILSVDKHRHFAKAAAECFITQPTLSMMIRKLEEELGIKIFDRSRQPVVPTKEGAEIISRARELLGKASSLKTFAAELKGEITGELHLGIIPTLAPYLLPLFLKSFTHKYPHLKIFIREMVTTDIVENIKTGHLDIGILATPLGDLQLSETVLFNEEFFVYIDEKSSGIRKKYLLPREIDINQLWLLEEGHCMRNQVFNLCELKKHDSTGDKLHYEAGSIETLINLVDNSRGITIVPLLATRLMKPAQKKKLRQFAAPRPVREISLVTMNDFPRKTLLENMRKIILASLPAVITDAENRKSMVKMKKLPVNN